MVQAILNGTKTQTRRVVNNVIIHSNENGTFNFGYKQGFGNNLTLEDLNTEFFGIKGVSPYGKVGDELWVRETWGAPYCDHPRCEGGSKPKRGDKIVYLADDGDCYQWDGFIPWRPSFHMPRFASRIQLRITDIRVERLQYISEEEAKAEGVKQLSDGGYKDYLVSTLNIDASVDEDSEFPAKESFKTLWDSINGEPRKDRTNISWDANPWVWVVEFEQVIH